MWVRSYDKKNLLDATRFDIVKNIGGKKEEKWTIIAYSTSKFSDGGVICQVFPDKESAIKAMDKLADAIRQQENFSNIVYEF